MRDSKVSSVAFVVCLLSFFFGNSPLAIAEDPVGSSSLEVRARLSALDFGVVVGDESVDNTAALQRALDAAGVAGGGVVELPSGRFRFDGTLSVPAGVTLQGTYRVSPTVYNKDEKPTGTTLLSYANRGNPDGEPFIDLKGPNSVLAGVAVVYPEWKQEDVPPVPYPPCVASRDSDNVAVLDCCLLNPYEGIHFFQAHRHLVRNVTGYPIWRGLFVDECYDIGRVENVHFWPFGVSYKPDDPFCEWVNVNGTAFEFARTDWQYVANTFCFGYGRGYYFSDHGRGGANGNFLGIGADSCRRAVFVEQTQRQGLLITNGEFVGRWTSEDSVCVEIGEDNRGVVSMTNCSFWGPVQTCVWSKTRTSRVVINACEFVNWDEVHSAKTRGGAPAIRIDAGRATLIGNSFEKSGTHLSIGDEVVCVTATGNQAPGGFRVRGKTDPIKTQLFANELDSFDATPTAKEHYYFRMGSAGDSRFVQRWYEPEEDENGSFRWSTANSILTLPLSNPNDPVEIEIGLDVPALALEQDGRNEKDEVGIFWGEEKVAELKKGSSRVTVKINPAEKPLNDEGELVLNLRCLSWRPKDFLSGSDDERELGVRCLGVRVRKDGTQIAQAFDTDRGKWSEESLGRESVNESSSENKNP